MILQAPLLVVSATSRLAYRNAIPTRCRDGDLSFEEPPKRWTIVLDMSGSSFLSTFIPRSYGSDNLSCHSAYA